MKETIIPRSRRLSTILALALLILVILGGIFHFWFINNTEQFFENIVSTQSQGKVKLKVKRVSFNYFSRNVRLQDAQFVSEDSSSTNSYHFDVADLRIKVKSVRSLIFSQEILIDSLSLTNPHVTIRHKRHESSDKADTTDLQDEFSIAREMGRIYRSIEDALNILQIRYFRVNEGRFSLVNELRPDVPPINISHIFLEVDNIAVNNNAQKDSSKFLFSDNIILRTHDQQIDFPGGRHRLSFGSFQMNVKDKVIEIDNCKISGKKSDTSKVAFDMFFRKLQLLNFDFAALANNDLIKADSVYCQDPELKLSLLLREKSETRTGQPFKLDEVLRQVGTNMAIRFAGLSNANVEITTTRGKNPVVFSSKGNDVFLYDFSIDNQASKPIQVGGVDVAIRNYDMVTRDGSTAIKFDSIQLRNNTIRLNNFSLTPTGLVPDKSIRNIDVPLLQITGLSWENLLVNRTILADKAVLHNPRISYQSNQSNRQQSFFHTLAGINELMEVDQLEIINGQFSLALKNQQNVELENINFSIRSNEFVSSQTIGHIERSIERFDFSKGMIKLNNLQIFMNDVKYAGGKEQLHASSVSVNDVNSQSTAQLNDVYVTRLSVNEVFKKISVDSVNWKQGNIVYLPAAKDKAGKKSKSEINIQNISGKNTNLTAITPSLQLKMELDWVKAGRFSVLNNDVPIIEKLSFGGKNFTANANDLMFQVGNYTIFDEQPSILNQVLIESNSNYDSLNMVVPVVNFTPSFYAMLRNQYIFKTIEANKPIVLYHSRPKPASNDTTEFDLPIISIADLKLIHPLVNITNFTENGNKEILLNAITDANGLVQLKNISAEAQKVNIDEATVQTNQFTIKNNNTTWGVDTGEVRLSMSGIDFSKSPNTPTSWKGLLNKAYLKNPIAFKLNELSHITLQTFQVNNLTLGSQNNNLLQYLKNSPALMLSQVTGTMIDTSIIVNWYNGSYNHAQRNIEIDSLNYRPILEKENFISSHPYQSDYLLAKTGKILIRNLNAEKFLTDSMLEIGNISADKASISVFRNKLKPRKPVAIKYLPTASLQQNKSRFQIDSISLTRSNVSYAELSDVTQDTGHIFFTELNAFSGPYKSFNINTTDSLKINATGYLFDKGLLKLQFQQSYLDSLAGFKLAMQARLNDATVVNQILLPVTNVRISSGTLDSLWLNATGNNYAAKGEMKMLYHKLKVQVKKNNGEKASLGDKLSSFIANNFLIRSHNKQQKTGIIFFERWQDRSVFNYMVKILVSGISTSIGLKSNAKAIKEYDLHIKKEGR